jgi:hypothetical protein
VRRHLAVSIERTIYVLKDADPEVCDEREIRARSNSPSRRASFSLERFGSGFAASLRYVSLGSFAPANPTLEARVGNGDQAGTGALRDWSGRAVR